MTTQLDILPQSFCLVFPWIDNACRALIFKKLQRLKHGWLEIREAGTSRTFGDEDAPPSYRATLIIHRACAFSKLALGGSIGTGESYVERDWECSELVNLVRIMVKNRDVLLELDDGTAALMAPFQKLVHRFRSNTIAGSKKNIRAHYDIGNDFFALFLDETWMYSCGVFVDANASLADASREKNDRICRKLGLQPHDHLVEIGTGWGEFAIHAATNYGCRVTTTTISQEQYDLATSRIAAAGLSDKITVLLQDYRQLRGTFDKLVSIEMIEAVGLEYLDTYFSTCAALLTPNGQMLIQAITIRDQYYERAKRNVDFIQRYIFPGSGIPSVGSITAAVAANTDLILFHQEDIGAHYARTLAAWSENLAKHRNDLATLGYPEELYRLWHFYFAYCQGGFLEKSISCVQMLLTKPDCLREPLLGSLPARDLSQRTE